MSRVQFLLALCLAVSVVAISVQAQDDAGRGTPRRRTGTGGFGGAILRGTSEESSPPSTETTSPRAAMMRSMPQSAGTRSSTLQTVVFDVVIADLNKTIADPSMLDAAGAEKLLASIGEMEKQNDLVSTSRARLATIDQQSCMVQMGQREPIGATRNAFGGGRNGTISWNYENTGTLINIVPRVERDNSVVAEIVIERSRIEPQKHAKVQPTEEKGEHSATEEQGNQSAETPPSTMGTISARTTVRIASGATTVLSGVQVRGGGSSKNTVVLVTARVSGEPMPSSVSVADAAEVNPPAVSPLNPAPPLPTRTRNVDKPARPAATESIKNDATEGLPGPDAAYNAIGSFNVTHMKASELAAKLTPMFADKPMKVTVVDRRNQLVIQSKAETLREVEAAIAELDVPK